MRYLPLCCLLLFLFTGCQPDVPVCTTLCAAEAACHALSDPDAAQAFRRDCVTTCSFLSTYGSWERECDGVDSDGFCDDWDTNRGAAAEGWEQYYTCVVQFAECQGAQYVVDDNDYEDCLDYLE